MIAGIGVIDLVMLGVLAISLIVGLVRGLVFEVLSLAGWVVAYFAAQWFAPEVARLLPLSAPGSGANGAAAFALVFIAVVIVWSLLARLVRLLLHATPLSAIDRVGGGAFGLLRGGIVLLALATLVRFTPASQSPLWQASVGAIWLNQASRLVQPFLPGGIGQWLPSEIRN